MRREASKPKIEINEGISKTSSKKNQTKPFDSEPDDVKNPIISAFDRKSNLCMKIIGLDTYSKPIKGCYSK